MAQRFGQGNAVDRARPHIFHRDYWPLRVIREELDYFLESRSADFRGGTILDYGAGQSPYHSLVDTTDTRLLAADIPPVPPGVLELSPTGQIPLETSSVDAVLSTQVLEHVPEVQSYLREAFRVLKPGKPLFCSTHGAFILHRHPTDIRRWTIDGLRYELEQAGFLVESIKPRIGILATATHLRSITIGGLTRRIPLTGFLRPLIYLIHNIRMAVEDAITPASVMESHPELLFAIAIKPVS